jgi:hypothetical protein
LPFPPLKRLTKRGGEALIPAHSGFAPFAALLPMLGEGIWDTQTDSIFESLVPAVPIKGYRPSLPELGERRGERSEGPVPGRGGSGEEPRGANPQGRSEGHSLPRKIDLKRFGSAL